MWYDQGIGLTDADLLMSDNFEFGKFPIQTMKPAVESFFFKVTQQSHGEVVRKSK